MNSGTGPGSNFIVRPGAVLGILGGGQLGRMIALAARPLGYRVQVLDPDPHCAAAPVVERVVTGAFDDAEAAAALADGADVVTLEIEMVSPAALAACAERAPLRPAAAVVTTVQDRVRQKRWLKEHGFPLGPWRAAEDEAAFVAAWRDFDGRVFAKSAFGGYDGRGQARGAAPRAGAVAAETAGAAQSAYRALPEGPCVVEEALDLAAELSVLVARGVSGETAVYAPAENHHARQALAWAVLPGRFEPALARRAQELAQDVAAALEVTGLLCVEMFLGADGALLVNELAPRPHNSYHGSPAACVTGQFEQLVRAVTGLPLGQPDAVRPAAIANLFGDLWEGGREPAWERALAVPGVTLHLYGKPGPRPGRKMGHLAATAETPEAAVERVQRALEALAPESRNSF